METLHANCTYYRKTFEELTEEELCLLEKARNATYRSYSPYSHFRVGAAVMLDDGTVVSGSNQENVSYSMTLCAERTALFYANSRYPDRKVSQVCIAARSTDGSFTPQPITPCGACRQVMLEVEGRQGAPVRIMLCGTEEVYIVNSAKDLLPISFDNTYL